MSLLVMSDIHGDIDGLNKVLDQEHFDRVLFLGDMASYYGNYSDDLIKNTLLGINAIMVCGNCDSYINMYLDLPEYTHYEYNGVKITLTHGHIYTERLLPPECGNILLLGHSHIGRIAKVDNLIVANPGSISKPRGGSVASYIIINDSDVILKDIDGNIIEKMAYN